ncbi:hypothetical protein [uncultured Nocardioides sp.]|uniref:hypothetical protein n=1 Tax=uncultured Nocardioides sp. TaxID=198441 RepID=UPI002614CC31|nr:hypothetical protein [uncultured Nocardioides sp.]
MSEIHQQAKDRYGGVKVGSAFLGFVTSLGMVVLLSAVLAVTGFGLGAITDTGTGDALERAGEETGASAYELGVAGIVVVLVVLFLAYLAGGYVAGRMARFHGVRQGVAVWGWAVLVAVALGVAAAVLGNDSSGAEELSPLSPPSGELGVGLAGLAIVAAVTLVGAMLGGLAGMRFHRRVDRAEADELGASDAARDHHA